MPADAGGVLEKARGKVALEPGYSLAAWMKLSASGTDLGGAVGAVDPDEDECTWKEWTPAEVMQHNSAEDCWMILRGKVYNITPYLRYHPGGVNTLLKAAGSDGTALFDKFHPWVNADGILEACCVGRLAISPLSSSAGSSRVNTPPTDTSPVPATGDPPGRPRAIKWDEEGIRTHDEERGVMFGAPPPPAASARSRPCTLRLISTLHTRAPRARLALSFACE